MKARFVIEAIDAMKSAETILNHPFDKHTPEAYWKAYEALSKARINLSVYSGIESVDVKVEA